MAGMLKLSFQNQKLTTAVNMEDLEDKADPVLEQTVINTKENPKEEHKGMLKSKA